MPMLCSVRDKWTAALRSGEFSQGPSHLLKNGAYCCLGVLCEVIEVKKQECETGIWEFHIPNQYAEAWTENVIPKGFAGLTDSQCNRLASLNDDDSMSFSDIANWIETEIPCTETGE